MRAGRLLVRRLHGPLASSADLDCPESLEAHHLDKSARLQAAHDAGRSARAFAADQHLQIEIERAGPLVRRSLTQRVVDDRLSGAHLLARAWIERAHDLYPLVSDAKRYIERDECQDGDADDLHHTPPSAAVGLRAAITSRTVSLMYDGDLAISAGSRLSI